MRALCCERRRPAWFVGGLLIESLIQINGTLPVALMLITDER